MGDGIRLDRFLWFARICGSRSLAQAIIADGAMRIDGRHVNKPATVVRVGNVLTFAMHHDIVRVIRIEALPQRRGPAPEARECYTELTLIDVPPPQN